MAQFVLAHDNEMTQVDLALMLQGGCEIIIVKNNTTKQNKNSSTEWLQIVDEQRV